MTDFKFIKYNDNYKSYELLFKKDKKINQYFSQDSCYLILYKNFIIGFFKLTELYNHRIDIQIGILKNHRNKGLGTKIYKYISEFVFDLYPQNFEIILNIDYQNEASKKCASHAGFKIEYDEYKKRQEFGEGQNLIPYIKRK